MHSLEAIKICLTLLLEIYLDKVQHVHLSVNKFFLYYACIKVSTL